MTTNGVMFFFFFCFFYLYPFAVTLVIIM